MTIPDALTDQIALISPAGFYVALRVGFSFPESEVNKLPEPWVEFYTTHGLVVHDPSLKWVYTHSGAVRANELGLPDPQQVRATGELFGLLYGAVASFSAKADKGRRSYGLFFRADRDFTDTELGGLLRIIERLHIGREDEPTLTAAEIEALKMQADGMRLKQIAGRLGISESAVKARLNNVKRKLGARTQSQAASIAAARRIL